MKGSLVYEIEDNVYNVSEGDVVFVSPGKSHKEICDPESDFEVMFICFNFFKDGKNFDISKHIDIPEVARITNIKEIYEIFENILSEVTYRETGYLLKINAQVYSLLVSLYRNKSDLDRKVESIKKISTIRKKRIAQDIREYLEVNYNQKISLNELTKIFFLSPQYISSLFKKQTGYTPIEYLNKVRISKAKEIMSSGENNISRVAEEVGISDIHYFYKVFKQFEKKTPVQFITRGSMPED